MNKKVIGFLAFMIGLLVVITSSIVLSQDAEPTATPGESFVSVPEAFLRVGPGMTFVTAGSLPEGTPLTPININEDATWVMVEFRGGFAWIRRDLATWVEDIDSLPMLQTPLTPTVVPGQETPTPRLVTLTPEGNYVIASRSNILVRYGPGQSFQRIGRLHPGATIEPFAMDETGNWVMIRFILYPTEATWQPGLEAEFDGFGWIAANLVYWTVDLEDLPIIYDDNLTPTITFTPSADVTSTDEPTATSEPTSTPTDEPTATSEPTSTPTDEPTATSEPTSTPTDEPTATSEPTSTPTDEPTATSEPTSTPTDEPTATSEPTFTPTDEPTATSEPTSTPTDEPTVTSEPTVTEAISRIQSVPTSTPTDEPTATSEPTSTPTDEPTATSEPTSTPTDEPTATAEPTSTPTDEPTATNEPTSTPTAEPTATPEPTSTPTDEPTSGPVFIPTATTDPTAVAMVVDPPPTAPETTVPGGDNGGGIPPEALIGGFGVLMVLGYVGLYLRGLAIVGRYSGGFVVDTCPICEQGNLSVETKMDRLFGIPRAKRIIRCDNCRSMLREVGEHSWRYAVDPLENPSIYERYNNEVITERELIALADQPRKTTSAGKGTPPAFVEGSEDE